MDLTAYTSIDINDLTEVSKLARMTAEQAIILFFDEQKNVLVLSGQRFADTWTVAPSLGLIINFIKETQKLFQYTIVMHNHPLLPWHGANIPSSEDIASTELLRWQLALLGINLVDHILVCGDKKCSFREYGLYHNGSIKINGFEIKRFLYCFMVQAALSLKNESSLDVVIDLLEKNLDLIRDYYEKPYWARFFSPHPGQNSFKQELLQLKPRDPLIKQLIAALVKLDDHKLIQLRIENILPFGTALQRRLINRTG